MRNNGVVDLLSNLSSGFGVGLRQSTFSFLFIVLNMGV
jgi:hypothetical protein